MVEPSSHSLGPNPVHPPSQQPNLANTGLPVTKKLIAIVKRTLNQKTTLDSTSALTEAQNLQKASVTELKVERSQKPISRLIQRIGNMFKGMDSKLRESLLNTCRLSYIQIL